jgi:hypothetical protein
LAVEGGFHADDNQRFIYAAPRLEPVTRRVVWDPQSPAFEGNMDLDYEPRIAGQK